MAKRADVTMTTTIDFRDIERRLVDAERRVFMAHVRVIKDAIRARWTGWKYEDRPVGALRYVSKRTWKSVIQTTESAATLIIFNQARDWRTGTRAYVAYVHRQGSTELEVDVVAKDLKDNYYPAMKADLIAAVRATVNAPRRPRKLRSMGTEPRRVLRGVGA